MYAAASQPLQLWMCDTRPEVMRGNKLNSPSVLLITIYYICVCVCVCVCVCACVWMCDTPRGNEKVNSRVYFLGTELHLLQTIVTCVFLFVRVCFLGPTRIPQRTRCCVLL